VPGVYPRTQFRTGSESGAISPAARFNTRFTWGAVHAPSPRVVGISLALSPAAICLSAVCLQLRFRRCDTAALADARCWRAAADCMRIFTDGLTPRLPPSLVPRALVTVIAAFVCTAEHVRCPRRAVEPSRFRWLVAGTDCRVSVQPQCAVIGRASVTMVALQAGVG
jgi:hypothetical protein